MATRTEFVELQTQRTTSISLKTTVQDGKIQLQSAVGDSVSLLTQRTKTISLVTQIITEEVEQ